MGRFHNPILPGCHPDPSVCRFGDRFLLVTSTFEYLPGLPIHSSGNLVDWELVGHAIHRPGQLDLAGIDSSSGLYAPTIRVVGDTIVVVCTVVGPESGSWQGRLGHFLVTATDPAGPWSDPVWIEGVGGFDPSITVDGDRVWLCGTRVSQPSAWRGQTEVWVAELELESGRLVTDPVAVWSGAATRAVWAEGPHIVPRPGGGWMLLAAEGGTDLDHAVCVAYADEVTGPYVGDPGNPRLTHRDLGERALIHAVGHADIVDDREGGTWAVLLATHPVDGRRGLLGRRTSLIPVAWEDRRPLFAPGEGRLRSVVSVERVPDQAPPASDICDDFDSAALDGAWNGVGRMPESFADLAVRPGFVRLIAGDEPSRLGGVPAFLGRRLPSERSVAETVFEVVPGAQPVRGGILLRVSEHAQLEVSADRDGAVRLVRTDGGGAVELARTILDPTAPFAFRLEIHDLRVRVFAAGEAIADVDVASLAPTPPRGFVGAWVGPVAVGQGAVDVDVFALRCVD